VSGSELREDVFGIVAPLTDRQLRQAGITATDYCIRNGLSYDQTVELLEMAGILPTDSPASTDANGQTVYPESQRKRRERHREYKRNRKDAS